MTPAPVGVQHQRTLTGLVRDFLKLGSSGFGGPIAGAAIVIAGEIIASAWSVLIAVLAVALLLQKWRKVPEPALVGAAVLVGLVTFGCSATAGPVLSHSPAEVCAGR